MITRVEALGFRCLRRVSQPMDGFHVLIGPNASGKTTFLDVVAFLGDLVSGGLEKAVGERTANFQDLTWRREGERFELAIEARILVELRGRLENPAFDTVQYEVTLGLESREVRFETETLTLCTTGSRGPGASLSAVPDPVVAQQILSRCHRRFEPSVKSPCLANKRALMRSQVPVM
ncbi:MAG TPA: AAA family ATPase [Thermoanaerobaculia bacterium]|nr:AAA family ATPase [Thermoanaerobaculia bacterium]